MENPTLEEPRKRNRLGGEYDPCAVGDKDNARMAQFFVKRGLPVPWAEAGARAAGGSFLQAQRRREAIKGHKSDLAREARLERKLDETVSIVDQLAWQSACAKARAAGEPLPPPPTGRPAAEDPAPACPAPSPAPVFDDGGASMKTSDPSLNGSRSSTVEKRAERAQILAKLAAEAADLRAEKCANVPDIAAALTLSRSAVNYALSARYGTAVVTSEKIVGHLRALPAPPAAQRAEYERRSACALRATKRGDRPAAAAPQPAAAPAPSALLGGATGSATFDGVFSVLSGLAMPEMFPSAYPPVRFNGGSCGNPGGPVKIPIKEMMTFLPEGEDVQETTTGDVAVLKLVRRLRELRAEMAAVREALRHVIDN